MKKRLLLFSFIKHLTMIVLIVLVGYTAQASAQKDFDRALWLARTKKETQALNILNRLSKQKKQTTISAGLIEITAARINYQIGKYDTAIKHYKNVSAASAHWLEATEELAHTYGKTGNYAMAISTLQTVLAPTFEGVIGPEPYFILAITHLKTCSYKDVFAATQKFKQQFLPRSKALEKLAKTGQSKELSELLAKAQTEPLSFETAGPLMRQLPRHLVRDRQALKNKNLITARARTLAKAELKEIEATLNQLQIIEAEVIHRMHLFDEDKAKRSKQGHIASGSSVLKFPITKEVWLDELESYAAVIEKCPSASKRGTL